MAQKSFLDSIQTPAPCEKDWNEMIGDERLRFCQSCEKDVYNLSAMPRKEARKILALNAGKICIRYVRLTNGKIQTADTKLYKITRRASAIAAGVFGATLTLSAIAAAQTPTIQPNNEANKPIKSQITNDSQTSQISFTVYDVTDAVVVGVEIRLTNKKTKEEFVALTNDYGIADFSSIPNGDYSFKALLRGFKQYSLDLQIKEKIEPNIKIVLETGQIGEFVIIEREIPLFFIVDQSKNDEVKRLVNAGFDVNTKNKVGETALHIAVEHNNLEIVRFLIERGAKVNAKAKNKETPLLMIADNLEDKDATTLEILRLLISKRAKVNARNAEKETLLMIACFEENLEVAKILLEAGANPNLKDEDGKTAIEKTDTDAIKQLLKLYGAKE